MNGITYQKSEPLLHAIFLRPQYTNYHCTRNHPAQAQVKPSSVAIVHDLYLQCQLTCASAYLHATDSAYLCAEK